MAERCNQASSLSSEFCDSGEAAIKVNDLINSFYGESGGDGANLLGVGDSVEEIKKAETDIMSGLSAEQARDRWDEKLRDRLGTVQEEEAGAEAEEEEGESGSDSYDSDSSNDGLPGLFTQQRQSKRQRTKLLPWQQSQSQGKGGNRIIKKLRKKKKKKTKRKRKRKKKTKRRRKHKNKTKRRRKKKNKTRRRR